MSYHDDYDRRFGALLPECFTPSDGLWEMPL